MIDRYIGIFLLAAATLIAEVVLVRAFEVLMDANFAYAIVTAALLAFGIAGVYTTLRPAPPPRSTALGAVALAGSLILLPILMNVLPFEIDLVTSEPWVQLASFAVLYVALATPFFWAGLVLARLFTRHAAGIRRLYAWDLTGAALGSVAPLPLLARLGPFGLLILAAGIALLAAAALSGRRARGVLVVVAAPVIVIPFLLGPGRLVMAEHSDKRGLKTAREMGLVERTVWDPVAKIDVMAPLTVPWAPAETDTTLRPRRHIVYDGGSQSSYFYAMSGNLASVRDSIERGLIPPEAHFWSWGVMASHWLKRDSGQRVAVIGSAGGQEVKAALMFGASHVDGIDLVGAVLDLGKTTYADYTGGLFLDPRVTLVRGEGRSFLRSARGTYDIIQIFSNHTTSSLAQGAGATSANYLQTREAYEEHFSRLDPDGGILQVNHHMYPRIITTAAAAWRALGRTDFEKHVLVLERAQVPDMLPTILMKMTPWTPEEVAGIERLATLSRGRFIVAERPGDLADGQVPPSFFDGVLDPELASRMPYRAEAATDDHPFFDFTRKRLRPVEEDPELGIDRSVTHVLNAPLRRGIPLDLIHLIGVGGLSLLLAVGCVLVPLLCSPVGRTRWQRKGAMLSYFSLLGAGFIIVELTLLSLLMKVVGFPLHTFALVIFVLLAGAGLGSALAQRLDVSPERRWQWPFIAVLLFGGTFPALYALWSPIALGAPPLARMVAAGVSIFPLAVALGMPFPLGILWAKERHEGAVAWGWAMNGLFTAVGGVGSAVLGLLFGLRATLVVAVALYALAFAVFAVMRRPSPVSGGVP